jgi:hypothetical protein
MIQSCITTRSLNRGLIITAAALCVLWPARSMAQFKSDRDRQIVHDVLHAFSKECVQRVAADGELLKRLETESQLANLSKDKEVTKCFQSSFSQISGVYYLYDKICSDVSSDPKKVSDTTAAKQLLEVNKYQSGIRPFHSTLNDCLFEIPAKRGATFIIPLSGLDLDARALERQIEDIKIRDPFAQTVVPLR